LATNSNCIPGVYFGRFQRVDGTWTAWSDPVTITDTRGPSVTPIITSNGRSTILPSLDGSSEVLLSSTTVEAAYQWKRNSSNVSGATEINYAASLAGNYTLSAKDPAGSPVEADGVTPVEFRPQPVGCFSADSNPILVTTSNGLGTPAPPANFFASPASNSSITISWDDRSNDETGFELYRSINSGSGYVLVTTIPATTGANPQTYTDLNLLTNTTYYYRMRAVNASGGSAYTQVASASTSIDTTAPTAPVLTLGGTLRNQILLQWSGATDNVGIAAYDIYQNGALVGSVNSSTLFYTATNVVALTTYNFFVRARDLAGNQSPQSNLVTGTARNNGLLYRYYHHNGLNGTSEIAGTGSLEKIGFVTSFTVSPRVQNDKYAFIYEGFINIPTTGTYRFSTETNEGSRMWVNNQLVVNNDGIHVCTKITSTNISLTAGWYPVRVEYFENGGAECFNVRWIRPGFSEATIPSSAFTESVTNPPSVSNPSSFRVLTNPAMTYNSVPLAWNDNSNNEIGFEISRSTINSGTFPVIFTTAANTTTWTDNTVAAGTQYHYRIRAISATNASSIINLNNSSTNNFIITPVAPLAPPAPATLTATAVSATQINLSWENVAGETGYEIQKSSNISTGFIAIATVGANINTYNDASATGHTTFYYRVLSLGLGGAKSDPSLVASATTPNRAPSITDIVDQTLQQSLLTAQNISINVTDPDNDPITFQFTGLPNTNSFSSNGFGQGILSLTNMAAGIYNVTVTASDGIDTVQDSFVLTVNSNSAPIIFALTVDGAPVTPTPITAVQNQAMEAGRVYTMVFTIRDAVNQLTAPIVPTLILPPALNFATPAPTWTVANNSPSGFSTGTYTLRFSPGVSQQGIYENITIQFRDNQGGINQQVFTLVVNPVDPFFTIAINFVGDPNSTSPPGNNEGAYYESLPWNNSGPPISSGVFLSSMKDDLGATVKFIRASTDGSGNWSGTPNNTDYNNSANQFPADPNAVFTSKVRRSFWRTSTGGGGAQNRNIRFTNLNPSLKYKVTLYGAYPQASGDPQTLYIVTGSIIEQLQPLSTRNNTSTVRVSSEMSPNSNGELNINVRGTGAINYNVYINGLILEAKYSEEVPPAPPSEVALQSPQHNRVIVNWQDNSLNETEFRIYRSSTANGPYALIGSVLANIRTYTDQTASGRTTYYYKVSAFNSFGESAQSNFGVITTPNGIPVLTNPGTTVVTAGQTLQIPIAATDPENDPMVFSINGLPDFATIVDNGNGTGFIRFTPALSDVGAYQLTLNVVDAFSASAEASFSLIISDPEAVETFYVNFNSTATANEVTPWNNISAGTATGNLPALVTLRNSAGTLGGVGGGTNITRAGTWVPASDVVGTSTGSNDGLYPDKVLQSGWITTQTSATGGSTTIVNINGLQSGRRYNISILGSRDEYVFANTIYRVISSGTSTPPTPSVLNTEQSLNTRKNTDRVVRFVGVQPNPSGVISISVRRDNTTVYSGTDNFLGVLVTIIHRDATINGMVIESFESNVNTPRRPTNLVATALSKSAIRLTWNDNAINETGYEVQRATDPAGPFTTIATLGQNVQTWDNSGLPANTAYVYRVRAIKTSNPTAQSTYSNTSATSTYSQIVLVNINGSVNNGALQAPAPWFNINTETSAVLGADGYRWNNLPDNGIATTVDLRGYNHTGGGSRTTRGYVGSNLVGYPDNVMKTNYLYNANSGTEWMLYGLDPNRSYDLVFFGNEWDDASRAKAGQKIVTEFTVGPDRKYVYNPRNDFEQAIFYNVRPEADSTIYFKVAAPFSATEVIDGGFFNSFELRGYTPVAAAFDNIAPTAPQNLVASDITSSGFTLNWAASTDNVGVGGYEIFSGSNLLTTVTGTTAIITGMQPSTTYTISVRARDIKGNLSSFSNAVQVTTLNQAGAVFYYSRSTNPITDVANWTTDPDGVGGTSPTSFIDNNQHFLLTRNASVDQPLTVTGNNTKLVVQTGSTLTINQPVTGQVDVEAAGALMINTATAPTLGTLNTTSTVTFNGASNTVPGASYGNLVLEGASSEKILGAGAFIVNGNLVLADAVEFDGAANNTTQIDVMGNVTLQGAVTLPADDQLVSVRFAGGTIQNLTLGNQNNLKLFNLSIANNSVVTVQGGTVTKDLTLGTAGGGGLVIEEGSQLTLGKHRLVIEAAGSVNTGNQTGRIAVSKGDITINSTGAQISNLYFVPGSDTVKTIRLNSNRLGQVNVSNKMHVSDLVDVSSGRLMANNNLVLVSSATSTARIGKIGVDGSVNGAVEFQRYLEPKRVYRYMGAPVYATRIVDWQATMPITGPFAGANTNASAASLFYYDEPNGGWISYPGIGGTNTAPIELGRGYSLFQFNTSDDNKLRISGAIQQGNYTYTNLAPGTNGLSNDGWNLLSNVYAAPIEWGNSGWQMNDVSGTVWIRNNMGGGVFKFMVYNGISGVDYEDFDGVIAQGQAFWVKAIGSSPSIEITEDAKYNTTQTPLYRTSGPVNQLKLTLRRGDLVDKAFVHFSEESTDEIEGRFDALKLDNSYFNISTQVQDKNLAINSMSVDFCEKRIPLNITNATAGTYTLTATNLNTFNFDAQVELIDKFTHTTLMLSEAMSYSFDVTSDPLTQGKDRFELVISKPALQTNVTFSAQATEVCNDTPLVPVMLSSTQKGAVYSFYFNNNLIGTATGDGFAMQTNLQASALVAGNNLVEVRGGFSGCSEIVLPTNLQVKKSVSQVPVVNSTAVCEGESVTITATGLQGEGVYKWYESMSATEPLQSGASGSFTTPALKKASTYYVSIQSGTCESIRTAVAVSVDVLMKPAVEQVINMLISSSNEGNQWYRNGVLIPGANSPTYEPTESGDYFVQVQSGVCVKNSETIQFVITGLDKESNHGFTIYPNPAHRKLNVLLPKHPQTQGYVTIAIFNTVGQLVWEQKTHSTERSVEIDVQKWVPGLYMVTFETEAGTLTSRFIKE
jgi:fibronectin type 3 domain-containing protein